MPQNLCDAVCQRKCVCAFENTQSKSEIPFELKLS